MRFLRLTLPAFICLFLGAGFSTVWAHSGHKEESGQKQEFSGEKSIYAAEGGEEKPVSPESGLFDSSTPGLFDQTPPMSHDMSRMEHEMESMDHDMTHAPQVKLSKREWISTSRKGYGVAAGITVLAGLAFGVLSIFRPFE